MNPIDISTLLSYGAIGLGCALALFSFWLLQKEQGIKIPRKEMLKAIYVFIVFAFLLASVGFIVEFLKAERERAYNLALQHGEAIEKLRSSSKQLKSLMAIKSGQLDHLRLVTGDETSVQIIKNIRDDLEATDKQINKAIEDLQQAPLSRSKSDTH